MLYAPPHYKWRGHKNSFFLKTPKIETQNFEPKHTHIYIYMTISEHPHPAPLGGPDNVCFSHQSISQDRTHTSQSIAPRVRSVEECLRRPIAINTCDLPGGGVSTTCLPLEIRPWLLIPSDKCVCKNDFNKHLINWLK